MSEYHNGGNIIPEITREEHDGVNNAKRVNIVAGGLSFGGGVMTLAPSPNFIGIVTVANQTSASLSGNVTLNPSPNFIGIVTVANPGSANLTGNVTLNPSPNFIGIVTVANPGSASLNGNVTLDAGSKTGIVGNVTLSDSKTYIGLTTTTLGTSGAFIGIVTVANSQTNTGNVTLNSGPNQIGSVTVSHPISITGNLTLSDSKGFIGLVTAVGNFSTSLSGNITLNGSPNQIGSVTISHPISISGNVTLSDSKGFIGLVTAVGNFSTTFSGNVTLDAGSKTGIVGNVTLSDSKGFIGLVTATLGNSAAFVGIVTVANASSIGGGVQYQNGSSNASAYGTLSMFWDSNTNNVRAASFSTPFPVDIRTSSTQLSAQIVSGANYIGLVTVANLLDTSSTYVEATTTNPATGIAVLGRQVSTNELHVPQLNSNNRFEIDMTTVQGTALSVNTGTVDSGTIRTSLATDVPLPTGANFLGIVTIANSNIRSLAGNVTLSDAKTYIGLTTATLGTSNAFIGITTVANVARTITGNVTLSDAKTYIGLTTATLGTSVAFVGIVTIANSNVRSIAGNVTLSDSKTFIGLVTAWTRNAGSAKTLTHMPITLSTGSVATIAVPSTSNTMYITNLVLNSDATVRVSIKSGVTYLTGNASLGITLNPGGGWVETGAPDSPTYIGMPSGAIVVEKFDMTGTKANIGGKIVYFQE